MALNAKRPDPRYGRPHRPRGSRTHLDTITAAAEQLPDRLDKGTGSQIGEPWQRQAWEMFRKVPEFRAAARIAGGAMSQCRLVIARVNPDGGEPAPLDLSLDETGNPKNPADFNHPAVVWLRGFCGGQGGQAEMLDAFGIYFTVSGEGMLIGSLDPQGAMRNADPFLRMRAYSEQQVKIQNKQVTVRLDESSQADRVLDLSGEGRLGPNMEAAVRIWRPDPELNWRADAVAKSGMSVLEEIALMDAHIRASAISRLVSAGLLLIPEGMTLPGKEAEDDADPDNRLDPFMLLLIDMFSLAIKDPNSAAAMVPILLRGEREDLEALRHLTLSTPFDDKVLEIREKAVGRLGVGVDMPGEILTGFGSLQHWTGALITNEWKNGTLSTLMGLICSSLTTGALYPYLNKIDPRLPADVIVWFDDSSVRTQENVGPEASRAYADGVINEAAYRRALGYDESDAPTGEELRLQIAKTLLLKAPALAPLLFPMLGIEVTAEQLQAAAELAKVVGSSAGAPPGGTGDVVPVGEQDQNPSTGAEPVASAVPGDQQGLAASADAAIDLALRTILNTKG